MKSKESIEKGTIGTIESNRANKKAHTKIAKSNIDKIRSSNDSISQENKFR
jgi:hypothetical protein